MAPTTAPTMVAVFDPLPFAGMPPVGPLKGSASPPLCHGQHQCGCQQWCHNFARATAGVVQHA
jgi:hypothetical protein